MEVSSKRNINSLFTFINDVKTDFVRHDYPLIKPARTEEGITFLSAQDISAMNLNAIVNSGKRLKDFVDVYFLLEHFSLNQIISFFETKYPHMNAVIALKSLSYFDDIPELDPPKMKIKLTSSQIRKRIELAILNRNTIF